MFCPRDSLVTENERDRITINSGYGQRTKRLYWLHHRDINTYSYYIRTVLGKVALWSHQLSAQTADCKKCIVQIVNAPRMDSSLNPVRYAICSTLVPHGYHYNGFMATPELKHRMSKS